VSNLVVVVLVTIVSAAWGHPLDRSDVMVLGIYAAACDLRRFFWRTK